MPQVQRSWLDVLSNFTARNSLLGLSWTNKKPPAELPGAYREGRQKSYIYFLPTTDNNTTLWESQGILKKEHGLGAYG